MKFAKKYASDPEFRQKHRLRAAQWKVANPERRKATSKRFNLRRRYGLTVEQFEAMREAQSDKCAICHKPFKQLPSVDHDHATDLVRGLLCAHCNVGLGFLEQPGFLDACARYLERHKRSRMKAV